MKELSIKEKAKAYDEAIKRAKELLEIGVKDTRDKRVVLSFFPELAESKDEKIRKYLVELVEEAKSTTYYGHPCYKESTWKEIFAWLEKRHTPNPYSGIGFDYNGHTWGMCARDGGVEILVDSKLYTSISADKSKADKTLIRRPFKLLAGHRYFCIKTPVWTNHFYHVGKIYESINDDKIVDDYGKEHAFTEKDNCPPQYWFCEVAEPVQHPNYWTRDDEYNFLVINSLLGKEADEEKRPDVKARIQAAEEWFKTLRIRVQPQPKQVWNEIDEEELAIAISHLKKAGQYSSVEWLESLRPPIFTITDEELAKAKKDAYNDVLGKIEYHSGEPTFGDGWSAAIDFIRKRMIWMQKT